MEKFDPFPWAYLEEILAQGFEAHWPTVLGFLKEEYAEQVRSCPSCETAVNDLTWLPVLTCEESWANGQGKMGYLTVCWPCRQQISFLLEEICTEIEADTRAETGSSTSGITWSRRGKNCET